MNLSLQALGVEVDLVGWAIVMGAGHHSPRTSSLNVALEHQRKIDLYGQYYSGEQWIFIFMKAFLYDHRELNNTRQKYKALYDVWREM